MTSDGTLLARARRRLRIRRLNRLPGVRIASSVQLAKSAMIQIESDGVYFGGRIVVSEHTSISDGALLAAYGGSIEIGEGGYVGPHCVLYGHGGLRLGRNVMIGAHTVVVAANHGYSRLDVPMNRQPLTKQGIAIGDDVWIGANCSILDGVRIGDHAIVGAGSVVTNDLDAYAVAYGAPARSARSRRDQAS
jgi:acetyltransferase-like isoleucine patch superfamily enzyme